ncbi:(d)CMP kinase [Jeotgalibacillus proteolyticus]|uniref:Cytidylate kinase n=1 Tax=Jeotgalibacillus proteolyticus TaxID=2082395 RepID=A0A2S5GEA7_9BACL|nr:(d)CMP kinase [Jeotgalibacillus proteolyticus]PPA71278.1 (d)CMP kinase [Jeotgalibacillus proteolyticus]
MNVLGKKLRIALDGPAAAGKSTIAKRLAEKLGYVYIDTGAMYRTLTYKALKMQTDPENEKELYEVLLNTIIELKPGTLGQLVFLDGDEVTNEIRSNDVTNQVSNVAKHPLIRKEMVRRQQELVESGGIVMDGRDIGTHVIPDAEVKIFMIASVEERARRRFEEHKRQGIESSLEQLQKAIEERDYLDSTREASPLTKADDAIEIDTTAMDIESVVNTILDLVKERGGSI